MENIITIVAFVIWVILCCASGYYFQEIKDFFFRLKNKFKKKQSNVSPTNKIVKCGDLPNFENETKEPWPADESWSSKNYKSLPARIRNDLDSDYD